MKDYQDILGEKHDLEVWIDFIPKFESAIKSQRKRNADTPAFGQALSNFLKYVKNQRKEHYEKFVKLWEDNQKQGFFDKLRETTKAGLTMSEERAKQILSNPDVRIAVLSDVHANLQALEKVIQDAEERGVDVFINAGDSIGFGAYPNEVVELLSEKNALSILGNYDLEVLESKANAKGDKKVAFKFAQKELAKSCGCYLYSLPRELRLDVAGKALYVTHGSPKSIEEHIYHDTPVEQLKTFAESVRADILVVGHSHEQFCREENGVYFVNPGSVGRPGDGNPLTAYAMLTFNPLQVELIRLDYDVWAAADALRKKGLPESLSQMLLKGVSLEDIAEEDKVKSDLIVKNCSELTEASEKTAQKYWPDIEHYSQVTRLALGFFEGLANLHQLGQKERCWLECASILHDIGLSESTSKHHKKSAKLILDDEELPFASVDRRVIASIARYHRKGLPNKKHYNLMPLDRETAHKVAVLASLLRVADSLDYSHESRVKNLGFKIDNKKVTVQYESEEKSDLEEQAFNKKRNLFEKVFAKKLVLTWKQS